MDNKEHPDLVYIPEQDIYKLKDSAYNIWYPSIEVYEMEKKSARDMYEPILVKLLWSKNSNNG